MKTIAILALLGCEFLGNRPPAALIYAPVVAKKPFTKAELHEIRDERYQPEHSHLCELTAAGPRLTTFPIAVMVSDDWDRMRSALREAGDELPAYLEAQLGLLIAAVAFLAIVSWRQAHNM